MSENDRLYVRTTRAFKTNTQAVIDQLYLHGLREDQGLSAYVLEAVREKRERDSVLISDRGERRRTVCSA